MPWIGLHLKGGSRITWIKFSWITEYLMTFVPTYTLYAFAISDDNVIIQR